MTTVGSKADDKKASQLVAKQQYWLYHPLLCQAFRRSIAAYTRDNELVKSIYRWRSQLLTLQPENPTAVSERFFDRVQIIRSASAQAIRAPAKSMAVLLRLPNGIECELYKLSIVFTH